VEIESNLGPIDEIKTFAIVPLTIYTGIVGLCAYKAKVIMVPNVLPKIKGEN